MSSKLEAMICLHDTGHIGIHGGDCYSTITKTNFLAQMGYHISLPMVLHRAPLKLSTGNWTWPG